MTHYTGPTTSAHSVRGDASQSGPDSEIRGEVDLLESAGTVTLDTENGEYRLEYDPAIDSTSMAVVAAVAAVTARDPVEIQPLHSVIDTGALDRLVASTDGGQNRSQVSFQFGGVAVTVASLGTVRVVTTPSSTENYE